MPQGWAGVNQVFYRSVKKIKNVLPKKLTGETA
jgi:hypothetical protein